MCLQQTSHLGHKLLTEIEECLAMCVMFVEEKHEDLDFMIQVQNLAHRVAENPCEDFAPNSVRINTSIFSNAETI